MADTAFCFIFTHITSLNSYNNPLEKVFLSHFYHKETVREVKWLAQSYIASKYWKLSPSLPGSKWRSGYSIINLNEGWAPKPSALFLNYLLRIFFSCGVIKSMAIYFLWDEVRVPGSEI